MKMEVDDLEVLFLSKKHTEVVHYCRIHLKLIKDSHSPSITKQYFNTQQISDSIPVITLFIQSLFELKQTQKVLQEVTDFYGSLESTPFEIIDLCLNMKISLEEFDEAERLILTLSRRYIKEKTSTKKDSPRQSPLHISSVPTTREEYQNLVEKLILKIYLPNNLFDKCSEFMKEISPHISLEKLELFESIIDTKRQAITSKGPLPVSPRSPAADVDPSPPPSSPSSVPSPALPPSTSFPSRTLLPITIALLSTILLILFLTPKSKTFLLSLLSKAQNLLSLRQTPSPLSQRTKVW